MENEIRCPYCDNEGVLKYGKYKGVQRYWCKMCQRKFKTRKHTPSERITVSHVQRGTLRLERTPYGIGRRARRLGISPKPPRIKPPTPRITRKPPRLSGNEVYEGRGMISRHPFRGAKRGRSY